ncbi:hypothetical protein INH39_32770 [Massilia violaceinigra]|uniref:Uncharacterized protein n=1 Tax=Massilia violaceinigra TaxID=2045208 RepID=A0ABY4A5J3_9BURK|nr:hypothetical protein [Massilia violaceinigra]UOD30066.1 hypothetical protein INH39_32770 [Massilia violaceinigra]
MRYNFIAKRESSWTYETSAGGAVGVGVATVAGGMIQLKDPSGKSIKFHYGSFGAGLSTPGLKLPHTPPKLNLMMPTIAGSQTYYLAKGIIFVGEGCKADELTADDFRGPCLTVDVGAGLGFGAGGTAFLMGANPMFLTLGVPGLPHLIASSSAVLITGGVNAGMQAGAGISGGVGYVR